MVVCKSGRKGKNMKNLFGIFPIMLLALLLNLLSAKESLEQMSQEQYEKAREIAAHYDERAFRKKEGFNSYQKMEEFFDEYNVRRYIITTLYKDMDINQAYESYVTNSTGEHFENQNNISDRCKITKWLPTLPKQNKTLEWNFDFSFACGDAQKMSDEGIDVSLSYTYKSPKNLIITYKALGDDFRVRTDNALLILEFTQEAEGTYLKIHSKALPVSFDCKKANLKTEIAICNAAKKENFNEDIKLYYLYNALLIETEDYIERKSIEASQKAWLKERNQCQNDIECIKTLYKSRYGEISAQLQSIFKKKFGFLEHCASIHNNRWDGRADPEFGEYSQQRKCSFAGNIFDAYEAIKTNEQDGKYLADVKQIRAKKDFEDKISNDAQGGLTYIAYIDYKWQDNQNTFILSLAYEYYGTIYILTQKSPNQTEVIVEDYEIP